MVEEKSRWDHLKAAFKYKGQLLLCLGAALTRTPKRYCSLNLVKLTKVMLKLEDAHILRHLCLPGVVILGLIIFQKCVGSAGRVEKSLAEVTLIA